MRRGRFAPLLARLTLVARGVAGAGVAAVAFASGTGVAGAATPGQSATSPAIIHTGHSGEPDSLDPHLAIAAPSIIVLTDLFEGLLTIDARGLPVAGAAERYSVSPDGRVYTFTLRRGLTWSDGTPLDSKDFLYSFRRLADPATASTSLAGYIDLLKGGHAILARQRAPETLGVTAPDALTVRIELDHPAPYFPTVVALPTLAPVPRHAIEKYGHAWTRPGNFVGNGPFMLAEWVPNGYLKLVRNPRFHAAADVRLDAVVYRPVEDLNVGLRLFETGELETLTNFPPEQLDFIRAKMPAALRLAPSLGVTVYLFNDRLPKFRDPRVRRALSMAIDREALTTRIVRSGDRPAYSLVTPGMHGYTPPRLPAMPATAAARIAAARALLAAAGYGPDHPLEVEILHATSEEHERVAVAVASMWQAIGVKTKLRNAERQIVEVATRNGEFDIVRAAWFSPYEDPQGVLSFLRKDDPKNAAGYANPAFESLMDQAQSTVDPAARYALLTRAEQVLVDDQAVLPLYFLVSRRLVSPRVIGWREDNLTAFHPDRWLALKPSPETPR
jgi:ABC-type oligopeptide transport system substrate-binding subunit